VSSILLVQQRIADRHRQVIERTKSDKEPLQHRLVGDIDALAACAIAEPNERPAQFLGRTRGDCAPCTLRQGRLGSGKAKARRTAEDHQMLISDRGRASTSLYLEDQN
jgi:hypothetical protein